jgi:hypothetical protein
MKPSMLVESGEPLHIEVSPRDFVSRGGEKLAAALDRFAIDPAGLDCADAGTAFGTVSWEFCAGPGGRRVYSRKQEEYMADFCLVSRRVLDDEDHRLFRYYFLLGADWQLCARQLKMDRGNFFHAIYRIERTLGRAFSEIRPYALYPLDEYFGGTIRKDAGSALEAVPEETRNRLNVPLRLVA